MDDLFGDAGDISSDSEAGEKKEKEGDGEEDEEGHETQEAVSRYAFQSYCPYSVREFSFTFFWFCLWFQAPVIQEEEEEEEEIPETRIEVEIPKINTALGKHLHFVKLPNFLSVETRPFDSQTYEDEIDEDEIMDEEGRTRLKLKVGYPQLVRC